MMNNTNNFHSKILTKERWENICRYKKDFLNGKIDDFRDCPDLNNIIAESWIRCKKIGVDPNASLKGIKTKYNNNFSMAMGEKYSSIDKELIDLAKPLFDAFDSWTPIKRFDLTLDSLISNSQILKNNSFASSSKWDICGSSQEESVIGTNAYALVKMLGYPISVQGPEYFNYEMEDGFVAASPIFDENHNMIAILQLAMTGLSKISEPWDEYMQLLFAQLLGLSNAIATAIENKLQLILAGKTIQSTNTLLKTTLSLIDSGIIVIDKDCEILDANKVANSYLKLELAQKKSNFKEFLLAKSSFVPILEKNKATDCEEILQVDNETQRYIIQIRPLDKKSWEGAILSMQIAEKVDKMAVSRTGNRATFTFNNLKGESACFKQAIRKAKLWSNLDENVLLIGESGTGKELFAQSIHNDHNSKSPFIAVNCAAIPRELIESELFGYEKGSFTGADKNGRPGKIELAHNGTLFLDEIGDMPLELQAVLLRVLEYKQVSRLGSTDTKQVDFRLIAATNKNLKKLVEEKRFRQDLYFRLSVLAINIPPLRDRENDALILSHYFLEKYSKKIGRVTPVISKDAEDILTQYDWPGNARQLENSIIYSIYSTPGNVILPEHLSEDIREIHPGKDMNPKEIAKTAKTIEPISKDKTITLKEIEKEAIGTSLRKYNGNMSKTARSLGISASTLYRKVKEYGLDSTLSNNGSDL
ncbi:MAG: sigma 54-interacting transcriptional regulator [Clostridiales bacterium]